MVIHGSKFQETNRLLHQTLGGKEVRILEVTIVQGRKLVRFRHRVRSSSSSEIFIHVSHSGAEYCDLLDEVLECACMSRVSGPVPPLAISEVSLIPRQLFNPDVDQSLQFSRSQVGKRGVLPESECSGRSIADV